MGRPDTLKYVAELQELRDRFDSEMYFSTLAVDHCRVNFHEGIDRAVEAVMAVYAEEVLDDIQRKKERE